ncbi:hypothetical protein B0A55_02862 [Lecanosticta acicola]|uniref:Uncharacterized protein n=1 Tax=Lecanosticta acicola TaxID=111012 RepID=A0AAI8Z0Q3_9PEZI|nr:hypothetical protein B0A55_02862 [Lecanosticta acicola]
MKAASRRERTFIGTQCAACEEPLEHMLRGERILQLSCGHVAHEACFYEYIKEFEEQTCPECGHPLGLDTSRGANLDFANLNKLVRNANSNTPDLRVSRDPDATPLPWGDTESIRGPSVSTEQHVPQRPIKQRPSRDHLLPEQIHASNGNGRPERYAPSHRRNGSGSTGIASSGGYAETQYNGGRRHDFDAQSTTASMKGIRPSRNPIPAPIVTVRSEFPTVGKSRQQQSLTCLVTVEVVEGKWHPNPEDLRCSPIIPPGPSPIPEESQYSASVPATPSATSRPVDSVHEEMLLDQARDDLFHRVENWHGLDFQRFGRLLLHGPVRVGKDRQAWQELECYLFTEMLICVKDKRLPVTASQEWNGAEDARSKSRCTLKGSILIKRHLQQVESTPGSDVLTLLLSVAELPEFHLLFEDARQLQTWRKALTTASRPEPIAPVRPNFDYDEPSFDEDEYISRKRVSSEPSSYGGARSQVTAPTEYTSSRAGVQDLRLGTSSLHIPLDLVVVIPVSSSMHGLKMNLLRDSLRFLVSSLGERDRMGLVTFGSGAGGVPAVGLTGKTWRGWAGALDSIRPINHKNMRADVVEGANVAMDLLMQRKSCSGLSHILLISDSSTSDAESVDFLVSRAEAAKVAIHSFGLGLTHKPDSMVDISTRTKASYTYVKDWMMLRECLAGCIGGLQSTSHQNAKLRLRLPEGSPAKFVKISGALQVTTKRATGRDAEACLGDLRFGDKRDILVQLAIQADTTSPDSLLSDPWENIISGLEALGPMEQEDQRVVSVEEVPLIQADLSWGDILREGSKSQLPRPSLLAITVLPTPTTKRNPYGRPSTPPIPPHPSIVQRRMELLTSDMLARALGLVSRGQNDRAQHLLSETRSILKGLGKGGLPPLPTPPPTGALPPTPRMTDSRTSPLDSPFPLPPLSNRTPSPGQYPFDSSPAAPLSPFTPAVGIDKQTMKALDSELEASLEWIGHAAVFGRDSRKAVLQAIGVISSQRGFTFRTASEALWAGRIPGIRRLVDRSREWREAGDGERLMEGEEEY